MGWANGDFGLISDAPEGDRRRLDSAHRRPKALTSLLSTLTLLGVVMAIALVLQILTTLYWKYRANKVFYEREKLNEKVTQGKFKSFRDLSEYTQRSSLGAKNFRKYPIIFVFPSIFLIIAKLFVTGLVKNAATLLATPPDTCDASCKNLAWAVMVASAGFVLLGWSVLLDFNVRFRKQSWRPAKLPATANAVDDPVYRGISILRARLFASNSDPRAILIRSRGKFTKPKGDIREPQRTERLLRYPMSIYKIRVSDVLDAYQFSYFPLSGGSSRVSIFFNIIVMSIQLAISVLCGLGSAGTMVGSWAQIQVQCIFTMQFFISAYVWCLFPAHDRGDNVMFSLQFLCEATTTALLFIASDASQQPESRANMQHTAFLVSLAALGVPLLRRFYDGIIVQCVKARRKGPFNRKAAMLAFFLFLLQLQATLMKLLGIQSAEAKSAASSTSTAAKIVNREAAAGLKAAVDAGIQLSADAYGMLYQTSSDNLDRAATVVQSWFRVKLAVRYSARLRQAMVTIRTSLLAVVIGKRIRRQVAAYRKVRKAGWMAPSDAPFNSRPGLEWLLRAEAHATARERIDRIRATQDKIDASALAFSRRQFASSKINKLHTGSTSIQDEVSKLELVHRKPRLPPPPGLPPQLLAPPMLKTKVPRALSNIGLNELETKERPMVVLGEQVKHNRSLARGRYGHHERVGIVFIRNLRSKPAQPYVRRISFLSERFRLEPMLEPHSVIVDIKNVDNEKVAKIPLVGSFTMVIGLVTWSAKMILGHTLIGTSTFKGNDTERQSLKRLVSMTSTGKAVGAHVLRRSRSVIQATVVSLAVGAGLGGLVTNLSGRSTIFDDEIRRRRREEDEDGADEEGAEDGGVADDGGDDGGGD